MLASTLGLSPGPVLNRCPPRQRRMNPRPTRPHQLTRPPTTPIALVAISPPDSHPLSPPSLPIPAPPPLFLPLLQRTLSINRFPALTSFGSLHAERFTERCKKNVLPRSKINPMLTHGVGLSFSGLHCPSTESITFTFTLGTFVFFFMLISGVRNGLLSSEIDVKLAGCA